jgi:hypothetical protein
VGFHLGFKVLDVCPRVRARRAGVVVSDGALPLFGSKKFPAWTLFSEQVFGSVSA